MTILMFSWRTRRPQFPPVPWCGSRARWEGRRSSEILKSKHWNVLLLSLCTFPIIAGPSHLLTLAMRLKVWWTPVSTRTLSRKTISSQTTRRQNWAELAASDLQVWKILCSSTSQLATLQEENPEWFPTMGFQYCMSWGLARLPCRQYGESGQPPSLRDWTSSSEIKSGAARWGEVSRLVGS